MQKDGGERQVGERELQREGRERKKDEGRQAGWQPRKKGEKEQWRKAGKKQKENRGNNNFENNKINCVPFSSA